MDDASTEIASFPILTLRYRIPFCRVSEPSTPQC